MRYIAMQKRRHEIEYLHDHATHAAEIEQRVPILPKWVFDAPTSETPEDAGFQNRSDCFAPKRREEPMIPVR